MSVWTAAIQGDRCGYCGALIHPNAPMQLVLGTKRRCEAHAHGPVDWPAVEQARIDRAEAHRHDPPAEPAPSRRSTFRSMREIFDAKAAQAGRDD